MRSRKCLDYYYNAEVIESSGRKRQLYIKYKDTGSKQFKREWNNANRRLKKLIV